MDFSGRRVLIAGGTGNIGSALAQELLRKKAKVIVITRSQGNFEAMKKKIPADMQRNLSVIVADVTTEEGVAAIFEQSTNQHGGVQHVVASFGKFEAGPKLVERSLEEFNRNIKDRVTGHFLLLKAFSGHLEKQQGSTFTMLTSGGEDSYAVPGISLLCVASGALHGLSTAARAEFKDSDLAFSEVCIHAYVQPKPDSEIPPSDLPTLGHDLMARAILALMATRSRDRIDVHNRQEAQALVE